MYRETISFSSFYMGYLLGSKIIREYLRIYVSSKTNRSNMTYAWYDFCVYVRVCMVARVAKVWTNRMCVYGHTCIKSMDQSGKVASLARGQLNRKNEYSPVCVRA